MAIPRIILLCHLSDLLDKADYDPFSSMRRSDHCLHHVLPPVRMVDILRARGHPYNLPECSTNVHKNLLLCIHCTVSYNSSVAHFTPSFHP